MKQQEKLICIKTPVAIGRNIYERIPVSEAMQRIKDNPRVRYTTKSAYRKYVKDQKKSKRKLKRTK